MTDDLTAARGMCDSVLIGALMWLGSFVMWSVL